MLPHLLETLGPQASFKDIFLGSLGATQPGPVSASYRTSVAATPHRPLSPLGSWTPSPMHFLFLKKVNVPCQVSRCTPMMEPWPNREEKLVLSPLWWRSPRGQQEGRG